MAQFERLHDFNGQDGMDAYNRVMIHDNTVYTTAVRGGAVGKGTLLAFDLESGAAQVLHHFDGTNGRDPFNIGTIHNGVLWGITRSDEVNYAGTLFRYTLATGDMLLAHRFGGGGDAGHHLLYGPTQIDGKLYGLTTQGGVSNQGTLYRFDPVTDVLDTLHHFAEGQGTRPFGGLIEFDGWLIGTVSDITLREQSDPPNTAFGGVFRIRPDGTDYSLVHRFSGGTDGGHPYGNLVYGGGDWFYGTTLGEYNNLDDEGVVFRMRTDFTDYEVIHDFGAQTGDGSKPNGDVIVSPDGQTLYGFAHGSLTAPLGGDSPFFGTAVEAGTLFKMQSDGSAFEVLHRFDSPDAGLVPERTPAVHGSTLYGAAAHGGIHEDADRPDGMGTLFAWYLDQQNGTTTSQEPEGTVGSEFKGGTGSLGAIMVATLFLIRRGRRLPVCQTTQGRI